MPASSQRKPTLALRLLLLLQQRLLDMFTLFYRIATEDGPSFWHSVEGLTTYPVWLTKFLRRNGLLERSRQDSFYNKLLWSTVALSAVLVGIWGLLLFDFLGTLKWSQEILVPLLICWLPACLLLSSRKVFAPGARKVVNWWRYTLIVATILLFSVLLFRVAVHDVGGVVAALSVFIPIIVLLFLGGRPASIQLIPCSLLLLALVFAIFLYVNFQATLGMLNWVHAETAGSRILVWKEPNAQQLLILAGMDKDRAAPVAVTRRHLADAIEHTQENLLMVHEGGFYGLPYGTAPARRSQVRQDTVQYDSAFSFFVLSENGWVGGVSLLLIYVLPLIFVLISSKEVFDVGHGMAYVATGSFALSGLTHAAMNWGTLPFTGRNLPLLSVNSLSDAALWIVFLALGVQAMLWRVTGFDDVLYDGDSILMRAPAKNGSREFWFKSVALVAIPLAILVWSSCTGIQTIQNGKLKKGFDWQALLDEVDSKISQGILRFNKNSMKIESTEPELSLNTLLGQEIARFNALSDDEKLEGTRTRDAANFRTQMRQVKSIADYDNLLTSLYIESDVPANRRPLLFEVTPPEEWADLDATIPAVDAEYRLKANSAYNSHVNFHTGAKPENFPTVSLREGTSGTYSIHGPQYEFLMADRVAEPRQQRDVLLAQSGSTLMVVEQGNITAPRAHVLVRFHQAKKAQTTDRAIGDFEVRQDGLYFLPDRIRVSVRRKDSTTPLASGAWHRLAPGDILETTEFLAKDFRPQMIVAHNARGALIGPAWSNGNWMLAYDPDPFVPWSGLLAEAVWSAWSDPNKQEAAKQVTKLTLDTSLQRAAQAFVSAKGRQWHAELLRRHSFRQALPPRVAFAILDLPVGETLALGGWPRMNSGGHWVSNADSGVIPDSSWLENRAPKSIRQRYFGDRNFDRLLMGSSTKPLWASAVLAIHPQLSKVLAVRGPQENEEDVFGIPVTPGWTITHQSSSLNGGLWCDFTSYLAKSDNRYHIRLGFLGLTEPGREGSIKSRGNSSSNKESLNGGQSAWMQMPEFPVQIKFSDSNPRSLQGLQLTPLATNLTNMFGMGVARGDLKPHRYSFWTGDENDDWSRTTTPNRSINPLFAALSPEAPQLALDKVDHPRKFISLLLGGSENRWANVDFAGAFATAVQGYPVTVHITSEEPVKSERAEFPEIAKLLRPGLNAVIESKGGTAHEQFGETKALEFLKSLPFGTTVYAKTGTLGEENGFPSTSRLVLAIVRWDKNGRIQRGLTLSLVVERGELGLASRWLGEFLTSQAETLRPYLTAQ